MNRTTSKAGFTLVELLITIAIAGILVALVVGALPNKKRPTSVYKPQPTMVMMEDVGNGVWHVSTGDATELEKMLSAYLEANPEFRVDAIAPEIVGGETKGYTVVITKRSTTSQ